MVREYARKAGIDKLAPHDLRRTCARLCHAAGRELEQIQFLLGTSRSKPQSDTLAANNGCKQRLQTTNPVRGQRRDRYRAGGLIGGRNHVRMADGPEVL